MSRATHVLQWEADNRSLDSNVWQILQTAPQFGSESAIRLREVGIASKRRSARCVEYVPGPCTHRPSHHEKWKREEEENKEKQSNTETQHKDDHLTDT